MAVCHTFSQIFRIWHFFVKIHWLLIQIDIQIKTNIAIWRKKIQILEFSREKYITTIQFKYFFFISGTKILWDRFKALARLEKKYDETLLEFYLAFMATCKKAANVDLNEDEESSSLSIEAIDESKAKKILARVELFKSMREEVLTNDKLDER